METTFVRGFSTSFIPQVKLDAAQTQILESSELERTWKAARRQRLRAQEDTIWQTFVQEQDDVLHSVQDDPYQFLQQLPPAVLQQLMDTQLAAPPPKLGDTPRSEGLVSLPDLEQDSEIFRIYSDDTLHKPEMSTEDQDQQDPQEEDPDDEGLNDSIDTARTVRECSPGDPERSSSASPASKSPRQPRSPSERDSKSPDQKADGVGRMIESSIYCAKVREARDLLRDELKAIVSTLEGLNISGLETAAVRKMVRHAAEFSARLKPIQLNHTRKQINTINRQISLALPLHTQYHAQLTRADCLHRSLLQALQVVHRTLTATRCLGDGGSHLKTLVQCVRDASAACRAIPAPADSAPQAADLYNDNLEEACVSLESALTVYNIRVSSSPHNVNTNTVCTARSTIGGSSVTFQDEPHTKIGKGRRKPWGPSAKPDNNAVSARLSMYSLDTTARKPSRHNNAFKSRVENSGTDKMTTDDEKAIKKRNRRPLMRDPHWGQPRRGRTTREQSPPTMVEGVHVPSSNVSISPIRRRRLLRAVAAPSRSPRTPLTPRTPLLTPRTGRTDMSRVIPQQPTSPVTMVQHTKAKKSAREKQEPSVLSPVVRVSVAPGGTQNAGGHTQPLVSQPAPAALSPAGSPAGTPGSTPRQTEECEVTRLLRQLCGGDNESHACNPRDRSSGAKNAQLVYVNGCSPRQHSTPQLLKILEETIQKKGIAPPSRKPRRDVDRLRLAFNIPPASTAGLFSYRTRFLQHMLASPLYANGAVHRPWDLIGSVSEQIIDELLGGLVKEMQLRELVDEMYFAETH